ncbi:MAG: ATP-binding protein [Candidatus Omnitrophota bacterium]
MKQLRTRLIIAFLAVALMAMIPLAFIPYYTLTETQKSVQAEILDDAQDRIEKYIYQLTNDIDTQILFKVADHLKNQTFLEKPKWADILATCESRDDTSFKEIKFIEDQIVQGYVGESLLKDKFVQGDIQIIPKKQYEAMKPWVDKGLMYEEDNKIYAWINRGLFRGRRADDMELVGGLFAKTKLIEKNSGEDQATIFIDENLDVKPIVIHPAPSILRPYLPSDVYKRLYNLKDGENYAEGYYEIANLPDIRIKGIYSGSPMQARIIPILNQNREPAAYMILGVQTLKVWDILVMKMAYGSLSVLLAIVFLAVLVARSLVKPIYELADAARRMSQGDFDARVNVTGTEEQQVLRLTFNSMADRIQRQFEQVRQKTRELEESNRELDQTQHFLQNILANIRSGVMSVDRQGRISHINRVGVEMLHLSEWKGSQVEEAISSPELLRLVSGALKNVRSVYQQEIPCRCREGETLSLQVSAVPLMEESALTGLVVTFHDLSDIRRLEEQVRRQDRLAALGRMAAGVAHEIRNPLGIIRGSAQLLNKRFGGMQGEEGLSVFIIEEVNRLSRVLNDFLMFARPPSPNLEEMAPETLLQQVLAYAPAEKGFDVKLDVEPELPAVAADPGLTRESFLNLLINAQQAMPDGGTITLRAFARSSREVAFEVVDQGVGIHPEMLDQIFDPFYTSKDNGTGLGLSLVHQSVSSQGGSVEVESVPGQGSCFRLIYSTWESIRSIETDRSAV